MASLLAEAPPVTGETALSEMSTQVAAGVLEAADTSKMWPELARGLMGGAPSQFISILQSCDALSKLLPEVAALFGVPQISDGPVDVDLGEHLLKALDVAAGVDAPLPVRFALLVMNIGKPDSPREHLPAHYRHIERGGPRIETISARYGAPDACRGLALLALSECERVHKASKVRAGPVAAMLERIGGFTAPERFHGLMAVCACDYRAYDGRSGQAYPKAVLLEMALAACAELEETGSLDTMRMARAEAIARAFRSQRWSDELA